MNVRFLSRPQESIISLRTYEKRLLRGALGPGGGAARGVRAGRSAEMEPGIATGDPFSLSGQAARCGVY